MTKYKLLGLIALLLVGLYVVTAYAAVGPDTGSGTEDVSADDAKDFEPTDSGIIHVVKVVQAADGAALTIDRVRIKNIANTPLATGTEIDKIEVFRADDSACTTNLLLTGSTTNIAAYNSSTGVMVELDIAPFTVPNSSTMYMCFKVTTKSGQTPGRKFRNSVTRWEGTDGVTVWAQNVTFNAPSDSEHTTKDSGFKVVADATPSGQKSVAPGGQVFAQIIKVADKDTTADANSLSVIVNSITITNLGTATPADVASIQIFNCGTSSTCSGSPSLMGTSTVTSFPVTIPLVADNTFADDSTDRYIGVRITVSSTPGNTFRLRSTLNVTENPTLGSVTTGNIDVTSGNETIIEAAGFETFQVLGTFTPPATITSGATDVAVMKVQAKDGTSGDVNAENLKVTSITIGNLGTATLFGDITNIKIKCYNGGTTDCAAGPAGTLVVDKTYSSPATFPQTFTGADFQVALGGDIDINDNSDVTFEVQVTVSSTPGNTIQLTFALSGTEGTLGSFSQGPVNHTQVTTIASGIGCEVIASEAGVGPATVSGGDTNQVVQIVKCQDSDANSQGITVNSVTIDNLGTATPSDIARVAVYNCDDAACSGDIIPSKLMGQQLNPAAFPITISTTTNNTIGDDATRYLGIVVDVSSTIGNTIQTSVTNVVVTEGTQTTTHAGPFDDDTPSTITGGANRGCEAVTDLNVGAGSIPSGTSAIVQRLVCADSDGTADNNSVLITQVNVRNLGDAVGPADVNKIEIVRMDTMAVVGSTTSTANFGSATGVNIPVSVTVPDDGSVELGVRVYVTSTPGRTIQPRTTLRMFEGGLGPFFKSADDGTAETIAAPAACPPIVQSNPAPGQIGVLPATPALRYTAADQARTVRVRVINRSSTPIIVEDISEQIGQLFSVEGVTPTLPRTVGANRSVTFFVRTLGPSTGEASFPHSPSRPYFVVDINCQGPTGSSPASTRKLELSGIRAEVRSTLLRFEAQGDNIAEMSVQLYDLKGRLILSEQTSGKRLTVRAHNGRGQRLAKGVYLYVVTVRGWDGQIVRSEIRKIVVK